jgi:GxxExxY protein
MSQAAVHFDEIDEPDPDLNRITNLIISCCIEVHRQLGPGYLEAYYERALAKEFRLRKVRFRQQHAFQVTYKGEVVGDGRIDFVVEDQVILDLKAVETLAPVHTAQMISYLRATGLRLGILVNFNVRLLKEGIKRIAN